MTHESAHPVQNHWPISTCNSYQLWRFQMVNATKEIRTDPCKDGKRRKPTLLDVAQGQVLCLKQKRSLRRAMRSGSGGRMAEGKGQVRAAWSRETGIAHDRATVRRFCGDRLKGRDMQRQGHIGFYTHPPRQLQIWHNNVANNGTDRRDCDIKRQTSALTAFTIIKGLQIWIG